MIHAFHRNMPYVWKRAVLQRTRLSDSQFIGDLLAVICGSRRIDRVISLVIQELTARILVGFRFP